MTAALDNRRAPTPTIALSAPTTDVLAARRATNGQNDARLQAWQPRPRTA
jgi:hypothetical protein